MTHAELLSRLEVQDRVRDMTGRKAGACMHKRARTAPGGAQAGKETQQERMKRLMAAQISKQVAVDGVKERARLAQEERDAAARRQIERAAMGVPRPRSRSPPRLSATRPLCLPALPPPPGCPAHPLPRPLGTSVVALRPCRL